MNSSQYPDGRYQPELTYCTTAAPGREQTFQLPTQRFPITGNGEVVKAEVS